MIPKLAVVVSSPAVGRILLRVIACGGGAAELVSAPADLERLLANGATHVLAPADALPQVLPLLQGRPHLHLLLLSGERSEPLVQEIAEHPQVGHLFGLRYPDAPPRNWELLAVIRRLAGGGLPPLDGLLDWGATRTEWAPGTSSDRDAIVEKVERLAAAAAGERLAATMAEVAHELLMNSMFDAPVDEHGRAVHAHNRTAAIELPAAWRPRFLFGCDGVRLLLSVADPFGRLQRSHVFGSIARALGSGTMDRSGGGAGLGFMVMYRACTVIFFDVVPGARTQVTALLELDVPLRELRGLPRSLHFFSKEA